MRLISSTLLINKKQKTKRVVFLSMLIYAEQALPPMLGSQETGQLLSVLGLPYLSEDIQSSLTLFSFLKKEINYGLTKC